MTIKELESLLKLCQRLGVTEYKTPDLSFSLSPKATKQARVGGKGANKADDKAETVYTEEDSVFWSSPNL